MAIQYHCRHCGVQVGSLSDPVISSHRLGIHTLTEHERKDMIHYQPNGNISIKTICEDCQESLERNPDFHQYDYFIH
ncbi:hypothetical protein JOC78_003286 [Bacillus ectoiniformans]|uniref:anti-sigma-F factor Fin family protein n=1 Tax=Bacillus ectoiniformans TaxID=1494429 RepID=UPI00195C9B34|nr:anti-sigma-F factor Fin family protein [Bacillus ectoiniformans]MBM7650300.1 hypothetical protein [Bacillus ectoiniformans]